LRLCNERGHAQYCKGKQHASMIKKGFHCYVRWS
jgi:hypothetical protein